MTTETAVVLWQKILDSLEDKLQFGILEHAKSVVDLQLQGTELALSVSTDESFQYFSSEVNQQRLIILCRPIVQLEKITVKKIIATPLK